MLFWCSGVRTSLATREMDLDHSLRLESGDLWNLEVEATLSLDIRPPYYIIIIIRQLVANSKLSFRIIQEKSLLHKKVSWTSTKNRAGEGQSAMLKPLCKSFFHSVRLINKPSTTCAEKPGKVLNCNFDWC